MFGEFRLSDDVMAVVRRKPLGKVRQATTASRKIIKMNGRMSRSMEGAHCKTGFDFSARSGRLCDTTNYDELCFDDWGVSVSACRLWATTEPS